MVIAIGDDEKLATKICIYVGAFDEGLTMKKKTARMGRVGYSTDSRLIRLVRQRSNSSSLG